MRGIIYIRVSSDEQVKGTSLDSQEEACRQYCADKNIEILEVFREEGASAKSADRPEFLRAIEHCRNAKRSKQPIDAFVVAKVDRFARNTEDHFAVRQILLNCGTKLHSVSEPIGDDPTSKLFETILAGFSDFDNAVRRQRSIDGMSARANQGIYPRKPPIGYLCANHRKQGKKKTEPDLIDPQTYPILKRALNEFAQGLYTRAQLCVRLDQLGLAEVRGRETYNQFVDQLLTPRRLKFYAGIIENHWTGKDVPGLHQPLLGMATYRSIIERIGKRTPKPRWQNVRPDFPLRRIARCGECGKHFVASYSKGHGGRYAYYRCAHKRCPRSGKSVRRNLVEGAFVELLNHVSICKQFVPLFQATTEHLISEQTKNQSMVREKANRSLAALKAQKRRVTRLAEEGIYAPEKARERLQSLSSRIEQLQKSMASFAVSACAPGLLNRMIQFHQKLGTHWQKLPLPAKERIQEFIFPEGLLFDHETGTYRTAKTPCLLSILEPFSGSDTTRVRPRSCRDNGGALRPEDAYEDLKGMMRVWIQIVLEAIQHLESEKGQSTETYGGTIAQALQ